MNDAFKWFSKVMLHAILWVFILSIKFEGRPAFTYANQVLVQNDLVRAVDDELGSLWFRLSRTAKATFSKTTATEEKPM